MIRSQYISKCSLLLILISPLLTGCWDRLDPENMAFIMAVGVDPGPRNDYIYTFAVAMPKSSSSSSSESKSESKSIVNVFSQESSSLSSAMLTSQSYVARRLTLIHSKAFILGDGVARQGVMPILGETVRNSEFRRTVNVITTKGRADTYIQNIKPIMEDDIDLWFELEMDPHNTGAITPKRSRFHDFVLDVEQPGTGGTTILSAERPDVEKGSPKWDKEEHSSSNAKGEPPITSNTYAGDVPRKGETPIDFFGSAVYKGQKLVGYLTGLETKTLNILRGEFEETVMEFHDPVDPKYNLTINMDALKKNPLTLTRKDDQINISLSPHMVGELIGSMSKVDYSLPKNIKLLEDSVQEQLTSMASELLNKTLYKWNVDCIHIGNRLRATFPTLQEWYAYKWREHIKETKYHLNIHFHLKRHGDQVSPAVEGDEVTK